MRKLLIVPIVILLLLGAYLAARDSAETFVVGLPEGLEDLFVSAEPIAQAVGAPVEFRFYRSDQAMSADIASGNLGAYATSLFRYLEKSPAGDRVISSYPAEYLLIGRPDSPTSGTLAIGVFDESISTLLLSAAVPLYGSIIETRQIADPYAMLAALREQSVDYAVVRGESGINSLHRVISSLSENGYTADVLVLSARYAGRRGLLEAFDRALAGGQTLPDETETMQVMSFLFQEKRIGSRIPYRDIVLPLQKN